MSKLVLAVSLALSAAAFAAPGDQLHLNVFSCHRKTAPEKATERGWGDVKELRFFAQLTDGPKTEHEVKGLVEVEFYPVQDAPAGDTFRVLVDYQLNSQEGKVGLKGQVALRDFLSTASDLYGIEIPTFDTNAENKGDLPATLTPPQKAPVDFVCRVALQK